VERATRNNKAPPHENNDQETGDEEFSPFSSMVFDNFSQTKLKLQKI
jgi:hypothetical protein